jgi:hypothetical protein
LTLLDFPFYVCSHRNSERRWTADADIETAVGLLVAVEADLELLCVD